MNSSIGILFGIVAMLGFGVQDFLMAKASRKIGALRTCFWFSAVVLLALIVMAFFFYSHVSLPLTIIGILIFAGFVSLVGLLAFNKGLEVGNVSIVATVAAAWGAITAILGVIFLNEKITTLQVFYIFLIVVGTVLVSFELKNILRSARRKRTRGLEYAVLALIAWGIYFFLLSLLVSNLGWFDAALLVSVPSIIFYLIYAGLTRSTLKVSGSYLPLILAIAGLNLVAFLAYNLGVSYNYTAIVAPISAASPVVTVLLALLLLRERLAANQILGMALVLVGLILLSA